MSNDIEMRGAAADNAGLYEADPEKPGFEAPAGAPPGPGPQADPGSTVISRLLDALLEKARWLDRSPDSPCSRYGKWLPAAAAWMASASAVAAALAALVAAIRPGGAVGVVWAMAMLALAFFGHGMVLRASSGGLAALAGAPVERGDRGLFDLFGLAAVAVGGAVGLALLMESARDWLFFLCASALALAVAFGQLFGAVLLWNSDSCLNLRAAGEGDGKTCSGRALFLARGVLRVMLGCAAPSAVLLGFAGVCTSLLACLAALLIDSESSFSFVRHGTTLGNALLLAAACVAFPVILYAGSLFGSLCLKALLSLFAIAENTAKNEEN